MVAGSYRLVAGGAVEDASADGAARSCGPAGPAWGAAASSAATAGSDGLPAMMSPIQAVAGPKRAS